MASSCPFHQQSWHPSARVHFTIPLTLPRVPQPFPNPHDQIFIISNVIQLLASFQRVLIDIFKLHSSFVDPKSVQLFGFWPVDIFVTLKNFNVPIIGDFFESLYPDQFFSFQNLRVKGKSSFQTIIRFCFHAHKHINCVPNISVE